MCVLSTCIHEYSKGSLCTTPHRNCKNFGIIATHKTLKGDLIVRDFPALPFTSMHEHVNGDTLCSHYSRILTWLPPFPISSRCGVGRFDDRLGLQAGWLHHRPCAYHVGWLIFQSSCGDAGHPISRSAGRLW